MKSVKPHKGKTEVLSVCRERAPRGCESVQHDYHAGCYVRDTKECFEPFLQRALEHSLHIIQCNLPGWHFLQHTARETLIQLQIVSLKPVFCCPSVGYVHLINSSHVELLSRAEPLLYGAT